MEIISEIRYLVSESKTKEALNVLTNFFAGKDENLHNECILHSARITKISQDFRIGLINYSDVLQISNQVNFTILSLLKEVERLLGNETQTILDEFKSPKIAKGKGVNIFISYSHKDDKYKNQLERHLAGLKRYSNVNTWFDQQILPGQLWEKEIETQLRNANIILQLVSSDFLASDFCMKELEIAIERDKTSEAVLIPIILRPCLWQSTILGKIQVLPPDGKPISSWQNEDEAFALVVEGIRRVILNLNETNK